MSVDDVARLLRLSEGGVWVLTVSAGVLGGATLLRWTAERRRRGDEAGRAWRSIGTWWALFTVLLLVLASGRVGVLLVTALVSLLLLVEAVRLVDRRNLFPAIALGGALLYAWAWLDWTTLYTLALPVTVVGIAVWEIALRTGLSSAVFTDRPMAHYPILVALIGPAYVLGVASLPAPDGAPGNEMGWFLLLILLTELNDMAQAWWGRAFGTRPLAPGVSPRKTWEGLVGGLATTSAVAVVACPVLTSWGRAEPSGLQLGVPGWAWSVGLGLTIGVSGVAGDLAASALKRSAGVKDAGRLLPGHGGVLDRFDSIAVAAPVYFLLTWTLWFPTP